jgi:pilus assembly protein CpaC
MQTTMHKIIRNRFIDFAAPVMLLLAIQPFAHAQETSYSASFAKNSKEPVAVNVLIGQSRLITFDRSLERFSVSNPEIAEAVLVSANQVVINGKAFGQINLIAWEKNSAHFIIFDVYVRTNLSLIDSQIRALFPKDDIRLSQANGSVVLSGTVSDTRTAAAADAVIQAAGFKTVNMLVSPVKDQMQVQLQVRVAEVNRNRMRDLGASYAYQAGPGVGGYGNSGGGPSSLSSVANGIMSGSLSEALNVFVMGGNTLAMIRALQTQGALRALAEPNLIAMNGQEASFLAGGEFPVPVVQNNGGSAGSAAVSIIFKEYGVRLKFKPTILDEDHIRLELEPEVSTLDFANGVKLNGFIIPGLRTRRAMTGIELRDGQSFALAGLLDNSETQTVSKVPGLANLPVIGDLFKSKSFQRNESELIFIVTTKVVHPVNRDDLPQLPAVESLKRGSLLGADNTAVPPTNKTTSELNGGSGSTNGGSGYITDPAPKVDKPAAVTTPAPAPKVATPGDSTPATKNNGTPAKTDTSGYIINTQETKGTPGKP